MTNASAGRVKSFDEIGSELILVGIYRIWSTQRSMGRLGDDHGMGQPDRVGSTSPLDAKATGYCDFYQLVSSEKEQARQVSIHRAGLTSLLS